MSEILHDDFVKYTLKGFNWIILSRYYRYARDVKKSIEYGELAKTCLLKTHSFLASNNLMSTYGTAAAVETSSALSSQYEDEFEAAYRSLPQDALLQDQHDISLCMVEDAWSRTA